LGTGGLRQIPDLTFLKEIFILKKSVEINYKARNEHNSPHLLLNIGGSSYQKLGLRA
jgi:hypothetical protein